MSHTLTEGGQITSHRLRMLRQVIKITLLSSILMGGGVFFYLMANCPKCHFMALWYYLKAQALEGIVSNIEVSRDFLIQATHKHYHHNASMPINSVISMTQPLIQKLAEEAWEGLLKSLWSASAFSMGILGLFFFRGRYAKSEKHLSGLKIRSDNLLSLKMKFARKASRVRIGPLPMVKGTESRHMMITGGTGSGKTNCLHHLLENIRAVNQKAIVVDTSGIFLEKYYRPGKDMILNPFDVRGEAWNPWAEGGSSFDYADLAESFIPYTQDHDSYWREAAKTVFVSLLEKFSNTKKTSELVNWLQYESLDSLCKLVIGTKAAAHMDSSSEKTASSIRSVAATFLASLECLKDTSSPFSIKTWLEKEDDAWLFLQSTPRQRTFLRPLMSAWISSAAKGLLSLPVNLNRRIWFIIDELPTLQRIKDLEALLTEGRKYGGCGVLVLQTPAQLDEIYGKEVTQVMVANTATKVVFQEEDPVVAERISRSFGECEIYERQEGISYGAHETRDGVSLAMHKKSKPVVSPTQIMQLPVNTAFVKLPSGYGVTKLKLKIK
jgi:type IV conjugative transfer system coupling protein TraD